MARVHLLNTCPGDCTIIQHNSGRVSMIDICDGNNPVRRGVRAAHTPKSVGQRGNFSMCDTNTNPIAYALDLGIEEVWRFILTHPDMDHMDGFGGVASTFRLQNFWDTGSRRDKPDFGAGSPYHEADWDHYVRVRDGLTGTLSAIRRAGDRFSFANVEGGDGLSILAPDEDLVNDCNMNDDINDGSYVIKYLSSQNRVLLPGDAHDNTWNFIAKNYADDVRHSTFMLAPHHGRDSQRSYDFLDLVQPGLTLIGCCPAEYIDYQQWSRRGLEYVTSNQCGNVVLEVLDAFLAVYIENLDFACERRGETLADLVRNGQGYGLLTTISAKDSTGKVLYRLPEAVGV
jgi:competence protein ComEC